MHSLFSLRDLTATVITMYGDHFSRLAVTSVAGCKVHMAAVPGVASHWRQFGCTVGYLPRMTDGTQRGEDTQATQHIWSCGW